nr:unnamed protein product [Callosobruchus analis]
MFQLICTIKSTHKKRTIPVIVRLTDINDNAPQFINTPYETTISEAMETVINTHLLKYLDNNNIIHDRQYGFRKHKSTGDLLAYVTRMWNRAIENHSESRVVTLNISNVFDRVWHEELLSKLAAYGLPPESPGICPFPNTISALDQRAAGNNIILTQSAEFSSIKVLEIHNTNNMSWHDHVITIAKTASQKLSALLRCRKLYTPEQLLVCKKKFK